MQKESPRVSPDAAGGGVVETIKTIAWAVAIAVVIRSLAFEPFTIPSSSMVPTLLIGDFVFVSKYSYGYSRWSFPFGLAPIEGRVFGREPKRGDVIVFRLPTDPSQNYIKRVVGLPGDRVQVREGTLFVNGAAAPRRRDPACDARAVGAEGAKGFLETIPTGAGPAATRSFCVLQRAERPGELTDPANNTIELRVPPGQYFFMGDNRDNSLDSRFSPNPGNPTGGGVGFVPAANLVGRAEIIWLSVDWAPGAWHLQPGEWRVVWLARYWWLVVKSLPAIRFGRMFSGVD